MTGQSEDNVQTEILAKTIMISTGKLGPWDFMFSGGNQFIYETRLTVGGEDGVAVGH